VEALEGHVAHVPSLSVYDTSILERAHRLIEQVLHQAKKAGKKKANKRHR